MGEARAEELHHGVAAGLSRAAFEALLNALPVPIVLVEPGTARLSFSNQAADELAGGPVPRSPGADHYAALFTLTFPDGRALATDEMPGVRASRGEAFVGLQVDWALPDRVASLLVSGALIELEGGEVGLVAFEDVTALRAAERSKDETLALLDTVFTSAPVGLAFFDRELRYVAVNEALAQINGVPVEQHAGRTPSDLVPEVAPAMVDALRRVLEHGDPVTDVEVSGPTGARPGVTRHWITGYYPVRRREGGELLGAGAVVTEITERVALLEAERRARERAERAERRAAFLAEAGELLASSLDYEETLRRVAGIAVPDKADWCLVDLLGPDGRLRRLAIAHADPVRQELGWQLDRRYPVGEDEERGAAATVRQGRPVLVPEIAEEDLRAVARDEEHLRLLRELGFVSWMSVPLRVRGRVVGALSFVLAESGGSYGKEDLALALELARRAGVAIENARLYRERSHIAQTLQRSLLPPSLPDVPGFELAARYRAAGEGFEVGGDLYDVFETRGGWVLVVGDVCGKGPEAAALTSMTRYTLRAAGLLEDAPARVLGMANEAILHESTDERFMTAVLAALDPATATLRIANAGHPPLLVVRADGEVVPIKSEGTVLGVAPGAAFSESEVALAPGDAVVAFTDGVLDAGAPARLLDIDAVAALCAPHAGGPVARLADALERGALRAAEGAPRDDVAILALRRL
jgi:PAS domain S-box-containing protein